jgi:Response regulator containing CheY-like receiver, AAA-type ATPase, and DNA-binding domains
LAIGSLDQVAAGKLMKVPILGATVSITVNANWCKAGMAKILVVDDEADCQTVLAMYLESQGYRVECAKFGY